MISLPANDTEHQSRAKVGSACLYKDVQCTERKRPIVHCIYFKFVNYYVNYVNDLNESYYKVLLRKSSLFTLGSLGWLQVWGAFPKE